MERRRTQTRNAPHQRDVKGIDSANYPPKAIKIEEWKRCLYINIDPDAQPFRGMVQYMEVLVGDRFPDLENVTLAETRTYDVDANWKIIVENAIEGCHFKTSGGPFHAQLTRLISFEYFDPSEFGKCWVYQDKSDGILTEAYGEEIGLRLERHMRNIIVTGGSRGIGTATCKKILVAGGRVLIF